MSAPADFATAAQVLAAAVSGATADPADAITTLTALAAQVPVAATGLDADMVSMQSGAGDLFRRAALVALCRASSLYQPSSSNDAARLRMTICNLLDNEIEVAGDQGQDATYCALRALRAAIVQDLTTRGAGLVGLITVSVPAAMPAPVLAQRLYRDPMRAGELVMEANPPHPAFMPTVFEALSC